jgi:hypothetical protein
MICQHREWAPKRKVDADGVLGPDLRARAGRVLTGGPLGPQQEEDDMPKSSLVASPSGHVYTLTLCALHMGKKHVSDLARLNDIVFLNALFGGAFLTAAQVYQWSDVQVNEYPRRR